MAAAQGKFDDLIASFNEVSTGNLRGIEAFKALREIQFQLRIRHHFDPAQDNAYLAINTTRQAFSALLRDKYFLAAQQNYEGATDERFAGANRPIQEALSDLHLVPVYMAIGKEASGDKEPVSAQDWQKIGVSKEDYEALFSKRRVDEARRIWGFAKDESRDYQSFTRVIHDVAYYLKLAGFDLSNREKVFQAIGTTKDEFDALLARRQQEEQTRHKWDKVELAALSPN